VDRPWLIARLDAFVVLAEESLKFANPFGAERKALIRKLEESDPIVRQILNNVRPGLGDYKRTSTSGWAAARTAAQAGIGILREQEEVKKRLTPESPLLAADALHPWVWNAAQTFWESEHYAEAVVQAWKAINAHLQTIVSRRDVSDDALINATLAPGAPKPGQPKLQLPGDRSSPTWISRQRGLHMLGQACSAGIRNVLAHEHDLDLPDQIALEYIATLSVLSRWIGEAKLEEVTEDTL
jgi:hypothetical protein